MTVYLIETPDEERKLRIGFIISKKRGSAVLRNRIKRVIKETLREMNGEVCCGLDVLFSINSNICDIDLKELKVKVNKIIEPYLTNRT